MQEVIKYYTHTIRGDQTISDRQRLYARVSWYRRDADYNNYFNNLATGSKFQFLSRAGVIDDVYTLSPTTVLNVRYGYNRFIRNDQPNPGVQRLRSDLARIPRGLQQRHLTRRAELPSR